MRLKFPAGGMQSQVTQLYVSAQILVCSVSRKLKNRSAWVAANGSMEDMMSYAGQSFLIALTRPVFSIGALPAFFDRCTCGC